jgi:ERCC4-type nuclease
MVEINIDSREPIEYKLLTLDSGDFTFTVNNQVIRIERKRYEDLLQSSNSGRLAIQLNQLKSGCNFPVLAIIGYPNMFNLIDRKYFRNMLLSIKLAGIIIEHYDNEADYQNRLPELIEYFKSEKHYNLIPYRYSNPKLGALMWVSGIGYKTANRMLEVWQNSLFDIYIAPKQALTKIIGASLADKFYTAIRKPVKTGNTKEDLDLWG